MDVLEQKLTDISRLYANISFERLGQLLDVPAEKAEKIASQMISSDKIKGFINQPKGIITFELRDPSYSSMADVQIASICELTNSINERLAERFPEWHDEWVRAYNTRN